jgi:hypothetical protein
LYLLRSAQVLLYSLAIAVLWLILQKVGLSKLTAFGCVSIFFFIPTYAGWAYYTLTESLSVPLSVFALYYLISIITQSDIKIKSRSRYYILALTFIVLATLNRPLAGLMFLGFGFVFFWDVFKGYLPFKRALKLTLIFILFPGSIWITWIARNYIVSGGSIILVEQLTHPETVGDVIKPLVTRLIDFFKFSGATYDETCWYARDPFIAVMNGDTVPDSLVTLAVQSLPEALRTVAGEARIERLYRNSLALYQEIYPPYYTNPVQAMPDAYDARELSLADSVQQLTAEIPLSVRINSAMLLLKEMVLHSNTSGIYFVQEPFRGQSLLIKPWLAGLFVLHFALYVFGFIFLLIGWRLLDLRLWFTLFVIPLLLVLFFLLFFGVYEQRYGHIIELWLFVGVIKVSFDIANGLLQKRRKS